MNGELGVKYGQYILLRTSLSGGGTWFRVTRTSHPVQFDERRETKKKHGENDIHILRMWEL